MALLHSGHSADSGPSSRFFLEIYHGSLKKGIVESRWHKAVVHSIKTVSRTAEHYFQYFTGLRRLLVGRATFGSLFHMWLVQ